MTAVQEIPLRHLAQCLDGRRIPLNQAERSDMPGEIPYWGSGGVVGTVGKHLFDEPLVLLGEDGAPFYDRDRDVAFKVFGKTWVNNHIHALRPVSGVDHQYLTYALNSVDYSLYISGSTRDKLTQQDMLRILVPMWSRMRQQAIVRTLDSETAQIDDLIGKQERLIELLAEKRQVVITQVVTKGLDPDAPTKFSGIPWLGSIPTHWLVSRLKWTGPSQESGTSVNGMDVPAGPDEIGVLKTGAVSKGHFISSANKTVVPEDIERVSCPVRTGTLIVNRANTPDLVGSTGLTTQSMPLLFLSDKLWQIDFQFSEASFIFWWSKTNVYRSQVQFRRVGASASMQNLSYPDFLTVDIALPAIEEQRTIAQFLSQKTGKIDALVTKAQKTIQLLRERRSALISATVTGKIDVREGGV